MVHTSDDPADVVRELAVFLPWCERAALAASAWACGSPASSSAVLDGPLAFSTAIWWETLDVLASPTACPISRRLGGYPLLATDSSITPMILRRSGVRRGPPEPPRPSTAPPVFVFMSQNASTSFH